MITLAIWASTDGDLNEGYEQFTLQDASHKIVLCDSVFVMAMVGLLMGIILMLSNPVLRIINVIYLEENELSKTLTMH